MTGPVTANVLSKGRMIVRNGITSFYWRHPLPEFPFADFKRIAFACAARCGYSVVELTERGITPNFHTAILENGDDRLQMIGHSTFPIFAFAEPPESYSSVLAFRDAMPIAESLVEMFPNVILATAAELEKPITEVDLEKLNRAEIEQVKYWKPSTVGELAFNWWD